MAGGRKKNKNRKQTTESITSMEEAVKAMESIERDLLKVARRRIKSGEEDVTKNAFGEVGLEEFLVASQFVNFKEDMMARKYYHKSSDLGNPVGQFSVAVLYLDGLLGHPMDDAIGVELMGKASKAGFGVALFTEGMWVLEGKYGKEKDPVKANKMFHKALKDPNLTQLKENKNPHVGCLISLAHMRLSGQGCCKSYTAALRHFKAVEEVQPGRVNQMVIKQLEVLEAISGVEIQREADLRSRRLKLMSGSIQFQSLGDWILLYQHCGFEFSVKPSTGEGQDKLNHLNLLEWMERSGVILTLSEEYPAMGDAAPSLGCERPGCEVTEDTSGKEMKKCSKCQAPYCGVACQRKDWGRHSPVCEAVHSSIWNELTHHEMEILKQEEGLVSVGKLGISAEEFLQVSASLKECTHSDTSIPCGLECFAENGTRSMSRYSYILVGSSAVTDKQRQAAREVGILLPRDFGKSRLPVKISEVNAPTVGAVEVTTPTDKYKCATRAITLAHPMGALLFNVLWSRLVENLGGNCSCCRAGLVSDSGGH